MRSRATLPDARVLATALLEEMDQVDPDPLNNSARIVVHAQPAQARLNLTLNIDPPAAKSW